MKITKTGEDLVAKAQLSDLEIDELALVDDKSVPVNPGAVLTLVKSQPKVALPAAQAVEVTDEEVKGFMKGFFKSFKQQFVTPTTQEVVNPELTAALAKQAELQKALEETNAEIEKAKKPADAKADDAEDAADGGDDESSEDDSDNAPKGKKMKSIDEDVLVTLASSISELQTQIVEMNKSFVELAKGNAGAAVAKEAAGHVANGTREANDFVAAAKETTVVPTAEVEVTEEVTKAEAAILASIEQAFARNFEPVKAHLESLSTQVTEVAAVAKAATDKVEGFETTVTGISDDFSAKIIKALENAEVEAIKHARVNDIPNTVVAATANPVQKAITHQDLVKTDMLTAIKRLSNTQLPVV